MHVGVRRGCLVSALRHRWTGSRRGTGQAVQGDPRSRNPEVPLQRGDSWPSPSVSPNGPDMRNETILVTGASRGIGAATVRRLARPGRRLILLARSAGDLERRAEEARAEGAQAETWPVDLSVPDQVAQVRRELGRGPGIDGLVVNAGVAADRSFDRATSETIRHEIEVNYLAPTELLRGVLPAMVARGDGRIVIVGSLTSFVPFPGNASYCASKAALFCLARSVRMELRSSGVHLGVVLPGFTRTAMTEGRSSTLLPMLPEDVAEAVARCYDRRISTVVPGLLNRLAARMFRAFPDTSDRVLDHLARFVIPTAP